MTVPDLGLDDPTAARAGVQPSRHLCRFGYTRMQRLAWAGALWLFAASAAHAEQPPVSTPAEPDAAEADQPAAEATGEPSLPAATETPAPDASRPPDASQPPAAPGSVAMAASQPPRVPDRDRAYELPPSDPSAPMPSLGDFKLVLGVTYLVTPLLFVVSAATLGPASIALAIVPSIVHFGYGDPGGGFIALLAYPGSVVGGALAGVQIERAGQSCRGELFCGFGGAVLGGLIGMATWSLLDVFLVGPTTWSANHDSHAGRSRSLGVAVYPVAGGGAALSVAGRL